MKKVTEFIPRGVCSRKMIIETDKDIILKVTIEGGCPGNTLGVSRLCENKSIEEVTNLLKGIDCRNRGTSCPDQLAKALEKIKEEEESLV